VSFRVSLGFHLGFLIGISSGCLWVSSRVSLIRIQTGENKAKKRKAKRQERKEAEKQRSRKK
jgi:uncharacterized membrane protein YciS (DUF1049 family)